MTKGTIKPFHRGDAKSAELSEGFLGVLSQRDTAFGTVCVSAVRFFGFIDGVI